MLEIVVLILVSVIALLILIGPPESKGTPEHDVRFTVMDGELEIDYFLHHYKSFWRRIIPSLKYLFGTAEYCGMLARKEELEALCKFLDAPPIAVIGNRLIDGLTRVHAARILGLEEIEAVEAGSGFRWLQDQGRCLGRGHDVQNL